MTNEFYGNFRSRLHEKLELFVWLSLKLGRKNPISTLCDTVFKKDTIKIDEYVHQIYANFA